jgi:hypothetical protein
MHDPQGDLEPAALPARVAAHRAAGERAEVEHLDQLIGAPGGLGGAHPVQPPLQQEVLPPGRGRVGAAELADVADALAYQARAAPHVGARHEGLAGVRGQQRGQDPQRGGLAGSVADPVPPDQRKPDNRAIRQP